MKSNNKRLKCIMKNESIKKIKSKIKKTNQYKNEAMQKC